MNSPGQLAASVKARLQNEATRRQEDFNRILVRYGIERLLYRLGESRHADRFLVKGAMLFLLWEGRAHRPTKDLDLLGCGDFDVASLIDVFREIVAAPVPADGLGFDATSIRANPIREANSYGGIRVLLMAKLGAARIPLQIDVGLGDAVTPEPGTASFPTLLEFPPPKVRTYPVETVVAEKYEAMVRLGHANTRMKDFFDLWYLSRNMEFDPILLRAAIQATFVRRGTVIPASPGPLSESFASAPDKQTQWAAFLRRNELRGVPEDFCEVVEKLRAFIEPVTRP